MTGVSGKISQKDVSGLISQINVRGSISQKNVSGIISEGGAVPASPYCSEYLSVYNSMPNKPVGSDPGYQNTMLKGLVDLGVYSKAELLDVFFTHSNTNGESQLNWRYPLDQSLWSATLLQPGKGHFTSGIEGWVKYGNNLVEAIDDGGVSALRITYVDNALGFYTYLIASYDLTKDLVIGKQYKIKIRLKKTLGNHYVRVHNGTSNTNAFLFGMTSVALNYSWFEYIFTATSTTGCTISGQSFSTGEILYIDQWSIHEWTGATSYVKSPQLYNIPSWEQYAGFTGSITTFSAVRLFFNPVTDGSIIGKDNICVIIGVNTEGAVNDMAFGAASATDILYIRPRIVGDMCRTACNDFTVHALANTVGKRHYAISRNNSANYDKYLNLTKTNVSVASTNMVNLLLYTAGYNNGGVISGATKQIMYTFIFSYLTEAQVTGTIDIMNTYFAHYGKQLY